MEYKDVKINIILIIVLLVTGIFFGSKYLYKVYSIDRPLESRIMELDGVENVNIVEKKGQKNILLSLESGLDFYKLYNNINEIASEKLGNKKGKIIINNQKNKSLEQKYYRLHFAVYEGISTRKFVKMKNDFDKIAKEINLDNYKIWIDNQAVYLKIDLDSNSFYKRIPYNSDIIEREEDQTYG